MEKCLGTPMFYTAADDHLMFGLSNHCPDNCLDNVDATVPKRLEKTAHRTKAKRTTTLII